MKITIDDKVCIKQGLTPTEAMIAQTIKYGDFEADLSNLIARGIVIKQNEQYSIDKKWSEKLEKIFKVRDNDELESLAAKIQECFPVGKMRNRFGVETNHYYRCSKQVIKEHLRMFFENYGDVSDEDILDATRRYVASFKGNYNGKMRLAKYFIWKNDKQLTSDDTVQINQISDLADFLENKEETEVETGDWNTQTL